MWNHSKLDHLNIEDLIGLTPMQEGMLFHYISKPDSKQYFEQISFSLTGKVDLLFFRNAWEHVVKSNEMLRTVFRWEGLDNPVQVILKEHKLTIREYELTSDSIDKNIKSLADIVHADMEEGVDICSAPFRITLSKLSENEYNMMISFHHIILDGWSSGILLAEFFERYFDLYYGRKKTYAQKTRFKEYVKWIRARDKNSQEQFWSEYLKGLDTKTVLPVDYKKPDTFHKIERFVSTLDDKLVESMKDYAAASNITIAVLIYCAWGILLQKYNNANDVIFGTTVSGRPPEIKGVNNIVGLFINTLPLRVRRSQEESAAAMIKKVGYELEEREEYSSTPLTDIKRYSDMKEAGELFDSLVVIDNYPLDKKLNLEDTEISISLYSNQEITNYDLTLQVMNFNGIQLDFNYNVGLFSSERIKRLAAHFINILIEITSSPDIKVADIEMLGSEEKRKILYEFNSTQAVYPDDKSIQVLFEEVVYKKPSNIAVVFEGATLTYQQLNEKANQLAWALKECGVGVNTFVGLAVPRSLEMIIGIMAIFKANGVCLPLDINHPMERTNLILEDSGVSVLVELEGYNYIKEFKGKKIVINQNIFEKYDKDNPDNQLKPSDLAYIIYTSGSTGKPKGAMLHHKGIINHIYIKAHVLGLTECDVVGNNFSVNVVASIWQILSPLVLGGTVVVHSEEIERNPYEQFRRIANDGITIIELIPSILNVYIDLLERGEKRINLTTLRKIALTSEPTKPVLVNKFHRFYDTQLVNCYGQTECCDDTLHYPIPVSTDTSIVLIGKPSLNTRAYILGSDNKLQPIGVVGELCISGEGIAAGYWNNPGLTNEKFVPNFYESGNILYRTGDLARWTEDGSVECLGRIDHQIKIRGNRIELGEIETKIYKYPGVESVAVIAKEDSEGSRYLCAYIVSGSGFTVNGIRSFLSGELPDYSIPSSYVKVESMPLTPNGKIDRKLLHTIDGDVSIGTQYAVPKSKIEKKVLSIWQDILKKDKIGINDNFFDSGGHSLLLIRLQNGLNKEFGVNLSLVEILQYSTIGSMAQYLSKDMEDSDKEVVTKEKDSSLVLPISENNETGIAIIGMAGRFPGARNITEFWENLKNGIETVSHFENFELEIEDESLLDNPNYVKSWGIIEDVELFDASFFGFTPREAELMDPQQRLFMECSWEAMENAGYCSDSYNGRTGVYAGVGMSTYLLNNIASNRELVESVGNFQVAIGNDKDFIATRTAYKLNLKGPAYTVQTACSTSLVAVHLACQGILNGECEMALAGGSYIRIPQKNGYIYEAGGNTSPDGHCRTFDTDARGSVMGNGVGVVVLKRLKDAISDGDHIYAIIKGSAINNDGSLKAGYTAPSVNGQADVIMDAYEKAGIQADTIGYIETHGTGTELGDPIELTALSKAFGRNTKRKGFCAIGSLKTNIGHLDVAAGVSGLIKASLALKNKDIPPSLNFELPNFNYDFINSPFYVNTSLAPWEASDIPRRAGISSFGIGGTNVHMVLEEETQIRPVCAAPLSHNLLIISAKTPASLECATQALKLHLIGNTDIDISNVAYTLQVGRVSFEYRRMLLCKDRIKAVDLLEHLEPRFVTTTENMTGNPAIAMVFTDILAEGFYVDMNFYTMQPVYRQIIDRCFEYVRTIRSVDLYAMLYGDGRKSISDYDDLKDERIMKTISFAFQLAVAKLMIECGVQPQIVSGRGAGKYVALCVAGLLEPEDAMNLIFDIHKPGMGFSKHELPVDTKIKSPQISYISSSTGLCTKSGQAFDFNNEVFDELETVEIADIMGKLLDKEKCVCLVIGSQDEKDSVAKLKSNTVSNCQLIYSVLSCNEEVTDSEIFLYAMGKLWTEGVNIKWQALYTKGGYSRVPLPSYQFERQYYWIDKKDIVNEKEYQDDYLEKTSDLKQWFYFPVWKQSHKVSLARRGGMKFEPACWLVFLDKRGIGSAIASNLISNGCDVVSVVKGNFFTKLGKNTFSIDPKNEDDYKALISELVSEGKTIKYVVHLWSIEKVNAGTNKHTIFNEFQFMGFYSLLYLTKAFVINNITNQIEAWMISSNVHNVMNDESLCPEKSTLLGISKVAQQEHTNIFCHCVDILDSDIENDDTGVAKNLLTELSLKTEDINIAYRNNARWVQDFEQVIINDEFKQPLRLKEKGTYIITGGFGEIGHVFAAYLSKTFQANLVLTSQTPLPDRKYWDDMLCAEDAQSLINKRIEHIKLYENYGSKVLYDCVDVADEAGMRKLVDKVFEEFGEVHGVIHLAGITGEKAVHTIVEEKIESCEAQFNSKIYGIYTLEKLFTGKDLDFCLVVSSLCAILGGLGSATYASANIFIDTLANKRIRDGDFPLVSINWEAWLSSDDKRKWLTLDKLAISSEEGVDIFETIMSMDFVPRLVVSTVDIHKRMEQWLARNSVKNSTKNKKSRVLTNHKRPNLQGIYTSPQNEIEKVICSVWQELLGIDMIGTNDNFFELGGHSLIATRIISKIREIFRIEVPIRSIFERPTVKGLSQILADLWGDLKTAEEIAVLYEQIENLSNKEIEEMMADLEI